MAAPLWDGSRTLGRAPNPLMCMKAGRQTEPFRLLFPPSFSFLGSGSDLILEGGQSNCGWGPTVSNLISRQSRARAHERWPGKPPEADAEPQRLRVATYSSTQLTELTDYGGHHRCLHANHRRVAARRPRKLSSEPSPRSQRFTRSDDERGVGYRLRWWRRYCGLFGELWSGSGADATTS